MNSLVSIVIPYYNKSLTINRSIDSILNQTYKYWELIIIDDCGIDKLDIEKLPHDNRISYFFNYENLGAAKTRQRGLDMSNGNFICFLDGDDWWVDDFLERGVNSLLNSQFIDGVYFQTMVLYSDGSMKLRKYCELGLTQIRETLIEYKKPWQTGSVIWRKSSCGNWGNLKNYEDYWFDINSATFNKLNFIDYVGLYQDLSLGYHLSENIDTLNNYLNQYEVFWLIWSKQRKLLNWRFKILLFNRLLNLHFKLTIVESNEETNSFFYFKPRLFSILNNLYFVKMTLYILNMFGFKIKL
jgi:glycosyltransferase involved in cell wall biosynthesis